MRKVSVVALVGAGGAGALAIGLAVGLLGEGVASADAGKDTNLSVSRAESLPDPFPTNDKGETYGSAGDAESSADEPTLIAAQGDKGTQGYVRKSELYEPLAKSPDEAMARQTEPQSSRTIPLYDRDGKQIDTFTIDPGVSSSE